MLGHDPHDWLALVPSFLEQNESAREIVALTHTDTVDISDVTLRKLMSGRRKSGDRLSATLDLLRGTFGHDIGKQGDRRIDNPQGVADRFIAEVRRLADVLPDEPATLVLAGLAMQHIEASDIELDMLLGEVMDLGVFLTQMRTVMEGRGLQWPELKRRVRMAVIPSVQVLKLVCARLPKPLERKGSELNDMHLATLAPYADLTLVDKRMDEAFRQAHMAEPLLSRITNRVDKASSYRDIPAKATPPFR